MQHVIFAVEFHTMTLSASLLPIRRAKVADLPAIVALLAHDELGKSREALADPLPESYVHAFARIDADTNQELMVVESAGDVVATFQLTFIPYLNHRGSSRLLIESVHVRKDQRGQGLGEQMMRWAIQRGRERGAKIVQLTSDKRRPAALRFYERLGFVATHEGFKLHL